MYSIHELLEMALERRASDLLIRAGSAPMVRIDGQLRRTELEATTPQLARELAQQILFCAARDVLLRYPEIGTSSHDVDEASEAMREFEERRQLFRVFSIPCLARIRASLFTQRGTIGAALRILPAHPLTIEELGLPDILKDLALHTHGLLLLSGAPGAGTTSTLAAVVEEINRSRCANIFTVEAPIEYLFQDKHSIIHQQEVGRDVISAQAALRGISQQNADVIVIDELRDRKTIDLALDAANAGYLVVSTIRSLSVLSAIERVVSIFPEPFRLQAYRRLAAALLCITSQRLVQCPSEEGRMPEVEILTASMDVRQRLEAGDWGGLSRSIQRNADAGLTSQQAV